MARSNLERAAPALLAALKNAVKYANYPLEYWLDEAEYVIKQAELPDIDPVTKLPWNRDGEDE